jgi:hypothetical protein
MSSLLTGNAVPVDQLVFAGLAAVACAITCYALYHLLLRSNVEHGEMHPGNLRRGLWACFFLLACLSTLFFVRDAVHFPLAWLLLVPTLLVLVFVLAFRLRV